VGKTSISIERTIDAPPERVFEHATNVEKWAEIVPAIDRIEMLTPGPVQVGTRFRETRTLFGKEATEEMEFLVLDAPHRYLLGAESHGSRYRTEFRLDPVDGGTKLTMTFNGEPLTFFAKVMSVLMKPFIKKMIEMCGEDLDAIKAHVEAQAT
jgi:carbon monoxide dehydrogenase subunit G